MIQRLARTLIIERLNSYPAVALVGPRQSGKTTLARALGARAYDLEEEADRLRLDVEWDEHVSAAGAAGAPLVALDEVQLTSSPGPEDFARLEKCAGLIGARRRVLISRVADASEDEGRLSSSLPHFLGVLERL